MNYWPGNINYNTVFCYTDKGLARSQSSYDTLKVWLCHHSDVNVSSDDMTYFDSHLYPYVYYYGFDLTRAISSITGEEQKDSIVVDLKARIASGNTATWKDFCCKTRVH